MPETCSPKCPRKVCNTPLMLKKLRFPYSSCFHSLKTKTQLRTYTTIENSMFTALVDKMLTMKELILTEWYELFPTNVLN